MAQATPNKGLIQFEGSDPPDLRLINQSMATVDEALDELEQGVTSLAVTAQAGNEAWLKAMANIDNLITGPITRDENGAMVSAGVVWPDGVTGTYTATELSTAFPGSVDAYTITYGDQTLTQPAVTRDENGAIVERPAFIVI